jgi:hypothetical protein
VSWTPDAWIVLQIVAWSWYIPTTVKICSAQGRFRQTLTSFFCSYFADV